MPDPDTIMKVYRKVGTVSGLAERFQVPRHTVNHWARRLRSQGYDIGRAN
jgi:transposase